MSLANEVPNAAIVGRSALAKASWRLLPLLGVGYGVAYMDRVNISFAALRMNADLHFSATIYGLGGGLFFLAYALMEVPSNLILARVGARRWISRIMITWGVLAVGMMFVRTPVQFYVVRFLLGAAEAGFFPGAVFYLMHWFPAAWRGRAISGFYVAFPLSNVVMGSLAGALLGLHGSLGLAGWQWLFLVEGLPAIVLSVVFLRWLPDAPATASWLSADEKSWIASGLAADRTALAREPDPGLRPTLLSPLVIGMGIVNALYLGSGYAFNLSAPTILVQATHLSAASVGYLIAAGGLLGAVAMVLNSRSSDRRRERHLHLAVPLAIVGAAYGTMSLISSPAGFALAYLVAATAAAGSAAVFWLVPSDRLSGRSAAAGVAAINAIGMIGSFLAPYGWGLLHDHTGGYATGIRLLPVMFFTAAAIVLWLRFAARREEAHLFQPVAVDG
ncbi:MAG: transporter, family, tartrate transporter [Caulobacteraceae bacterium]|nr:transporter, family, tartrate transporter [Caulobacteraceae bacterium]